MDSEAELAKRKVKVLKTLPTIPGMLIKISRMVESSQYSAEDVGRFISQDQVLSAKVLKLANSAFYGFSRSISSVGQALVLLGFNIIKGLILTSSVFDMLERQAADLWTHSLATASAAGTIAGRLEVEEPEEINLAGLLHDLGKVVMAVQMAEDLERIMKLVEGGRFGLEAEAEVLGFTHPEVGAWLGESWKLPDSLIAPIRFHHQPSLAKEHRFQTAIVHLADILAKARGLGFSRDVWVNPLEAGVLDTLGLSADDLTDLVPEVHKAIASALSAGNFDLQ